MLKKGNTKTKYRPEYPVDYKFDYKDVATLQRFLIESGKIVPSRIAKLSSNQQRAVTNQVKKARSIALLAVGTDAYDRIGYPEAISPKPFSY